ncbi:hypothetical protein KAFR_0G02860 [Kazachstania africana CBS 2517]|uniref:Trafficking protein particle complex subunit n=1 Tax=Kazachstania africana (strain ATCC 22294 / BCRC 22015 / CBS 2517 / CECT 1963 / NBRC 1671 / NRRL Y-8276) TaxID=1071382 RepID=H2AY68_KAZAF|nr:hypothetical protein KAFR_0G02860 [Kazachstania africana CBS 2517]CCF59318.1 hypothetical protein KAFR_0G02860 [Kazachstania africana CBS 2517]
MPQYFAIIGKTDNPVYEAQFISTQKKDGTQEFPSDLKELNPFILHASLDIVEDLQWQMSPISSEGNVSVSRGGFLRSKNASTADNCYLGKIDHFYGLAITAYITYSGMKFVMIHGTSTNTNEAIDDNNCRIFYQEVHELYIKTLMNPFYNASEPITSPIFDLRVRQLAKKYLK